MKLTKLFTDPRIGGNIPFTVTRTTVTRADGEETEQVETFSGRGMVNFLPSVTLLPGDAEEGRRTVLRLWTTVPLCAGVDHGGSEYIKPDRFTLGLRRWRVTGIDNRSHEDFNVVTAVEAYDWD